MGLERSKCDALRERLLLYAYALRILGDHALAEEAIQDAFCIACTKREQLLSDPKPQAWIMLTLKHVMQNRASPLSASWKSRWSAPSVGASSWLEACWTYT